MWGKRFVVGAAVALCLGLSVGASQAGVEVSQAGVGAGVCVTPQPSANGDSTDAAINEGGRFVAFDSAASNLVAGDTNHHDDVFVRDLRTGRTTPVSVANGGRQGNGNSDNPAISPDGRFVAFESDASNLVRGDTNHHTDVFVRDRLLKKTYPVSVSSRGAQGNDDSTDASVSRFGRFVAFDSYASNLVPGDTNGSEDVFVHDRLTGKTERVSVSSSGVQGNSDSSSPSISADGRFVAFESDASNLVPGDTNGSSDVFVHDRLTGKTERVSVSSRGVQGDSDSIAAQISLNGRFVVFQSYASTLAPHPTTATTDVFVHDRLTGKTELVSGGRGDRSSNGTSTDGGISANGRFVVFQSDATNLILGDSNNNPDVFVRDRQKGTTKRVNCTYRGERKQPNSVAIYSDGISSNGRFVVFSSAGPSRANVFVVNLVTGKTRLVSVAHTTRPSAGTGRG